MKIERLTNDSGNFRCFEIENKIISRHGMSRVISKLEGVEITHSPRFYDDEVFCEFKFKDIKFQMTEPYGDSSVYDIVAPEGAQGELELIAQHFEQSKPIKGGDSGHRAFFVVNWLIGSFMLMALLTWLLSRS